MATYVELYVDRGTDFSYILDLTDDDDRPIDLSSCQFASQMKKSYYSVNPTADINCEVLDAANGILGLWMSGENSGAIAPGRYVYDIKMYNETTKKQERIIEGIITVTPHVTDAEWANTELVG